MTMMYVKVRNGIGDRNGIVDLSDPLGTCQTHIKEEDLDCYSSYQSHRSWDHVQTCTYLNYQ